MTMETSTRLSSLATTTTISPASYSGSNAPGAIGVPDWGMEEVACLQRGDAAMATAGRHHDAQEIHAGPAPDNH